MTGCESDTVTLNVDNQGAIALAIKDLSTLILGTILSGQKLRTRLLN